MPSSFMPLILIFVLNLFQQASATENVDRPEKAWNLKAEVSFGSSHDSNVSIKEIDTQLDESDSSKTLAIGLTAQRKIGVADVSASYRFNQTKYQSFSTVDRKTEIFGLDLSTDFFSARPGISFHKANATLGNEEFLEIKRWSPYLSGFLTKHLFLRGSYISQNKIIDPRPNQSAKSNSLAVDAYYFRRGLRNYFNVSGIIRNEDAVLQRYDNRSEILRFRMLGRVRFIERIWRYSVSWSYERRKYEGIWPRSELERLDKRRTTQLKLAWPISEQFSAEIYTDLINSTSTVSYASFEDDVVGFKIIYKWD